MSSFGNFVSLSVGVWFNVRRDNMKMMELMKDEQKYFEFFISGSLWWREGGWRNRIIILRNGAN